MDAIDLRERQQPLKQRYDNDPESASTPVEATGWFEGDEITCTVETPSGAVTAGLHAAAGGDGAAACTGDMLLQALVACAGVTLRSVAMSTGVEVRGARIHAEAVFDARGTLGLNRESPVGVTDIVLTADLDTDADQATLDRLGELTERYCVIAQSLWEAPRMIMRRAEPGDPKAATG